MIKGFIQSGVIALLALLSGPFAAAQTSGNTSDQLEEWKSKYDQRYNEIKENLSQETEQALSGYRRTLDEYEQRALNENDFDKLLAYRNEKTYLKFLEGDVPSESTRVTDLATLRGIYSDSISKSRADYYQKMQALCTAYLRSLSQYETHLTKQADIEMAMKFRAERDRVQTNLDEASALVEVVAPPDTSEKPGFTGNHSVGTPGTQPEPPVAPGVLPDNVQPLATPSFINLLRHLTPSMRLYLSFDDAWTNPKGTDLSGYTIKTHIEKAEFLPRAKKGGGISMSNQSYVLIKAHPAIVNLKDFTVSVWFKTRSQGSMILSSLRNYSRDLEGNFLAPAAPFSIGTDNSGTLQFRVGARMVQSSRNQLNNNVWHQMVAVKDGGNLYLYVDGEPQGSLSCDPAAHTGGNDWIVGDMNDWSNRFNGQLDELVVLAVAVSAQEAKTIYQSQR